MSLNMHYGVKNRGIQAKDHQTVTTIELNNRITT